MLDALESCNTFYLYSRQPRQCLRWRDFLGITAYVNGKPQKFIGYQDTVNVPQQGANFSRYVWASCQPSQTSYNFN